MNFGQLQEKFSLSGDWLESARIGDFFKLQRAVLAALLALLLIRLLITSHHRADELDGWLLVGGGVLLFALSLARPLTGLLASLFVMPPLNVLYMGGLWGNPASAMLPFAAVYPAWVLRWYWDNFRRGPSLNLFELLVDGLLWAGLLRLVTSAASPSLANGLWMFFTSPTGRFNDEFQWIQVGTFWLCFLGTLQIFLSLRGKIYGKRLVEGFLYLLFITILAAVLLDWFFAWPSFQGPYLTSPFLGLHELAAVMLAYFGFFMVRFLRITGARSWIHGGLVWISGVVVFATTSRTAWLALVVVFLCMLIVLCRSWKDSLRFGLLVPALAAGFFLVGFFPPGSLVLPSSHRQDEIKQLSEWGENRTVVYRLQIWQRATILLTERPLDGIGFGKFPTTRTAATAELYDIGHEELKVWDAHNLFLNVGLYQGLPTLVLFLVFWGCWGWMMLSRVDPLAGMAGPPLFAVAGFLMVNMTNSAAAWPLAMQILACFFCLPFFERGTSPEKAGIDKLPFWLSSLCFLPALLLGALTPQTILEDQRTQTSARGYGHFNGIYLFEGNAFQTLAEVGLVFPVSSDAATLKIQINPFLGPVPEKELVVRMLRGDEVPEVFSSPIKHGEIVELPVLGVEFLELEVPTPFSILPRRGWFQPAVLVLEILDKQGDPMAPGEFFYHPTLRPATK